MARDMTASATSRLISQSSASEPLVGNYFVAAYPPFFAWQPEQLPALDEAPQKPPAAGPLGLYVHVPFCQKKCDYCYYLSFVGQSSEVVDRYLDAVVRELSLYARWPAVEKRRLAFVYFGGGTPSTLSSAQVDRLAGGLHRVLSWNDVEEVTFEGAPRSVRRELLQTLRQVGVTRISMGVQTFDNHLLKLNGRVHLVEDVLRAYALIREAGSAWVNLDLMAGLLGETAENWRESVSQMIALEPDSVTIYQTEMPFNTQLYRDYKQGHLASVPVPWETKRARLNYAFAELDRAGYTVVSAYTAVKDPQRHRFLYQHYLWRGFDMPGLGVASFGSLGGVHAQNVVTLEDYLAALEEDRLPLRRAYRLSDHDRLVREFILQSKWGDVSAREFRAKFGVDVVEAFHPQLEELAGERLLSFTSDEVRLTGEGLLKVDRILPRFYAPQFQNTRYT
jgi:oxygen-independent coproporphyrinogen-3 oxidase